MKREIGTVLLTATLLEGCTSMPTPTPKPDFLVNCQKGPFDNLKQYNLNPGEEVVIGGITKQGNEDLIVVKPTGPGKFEPITGFISMPTPNGIRLTDDHLLIILDSKSNGTITEVGTSVTCNETVPPPPTPWSA